MRWLNWRRSKNVEDFTDPEKPVENKPDPQLSINEVIELTNSQLARDAGGKDTKDK